MQIEKASRVPVINVLLAVWTGSALFAQTYLSDFLDFYRVSFLWHHFF